MTYDCRIAYSGLRKPTYPSNSIWISDALLAGTIQRFTYLHLRHGSAVPGPLEARRRATRRKNASLTATGRGGAPTEVGALFGPGKKVDWWNAPNPSELQAEVTEATSILPSWLTRRKPAPHSSVTFREQLAHEDFRTPKIPATQPSAAILHDSLSECQSLQQIRELVQRSEINLLQTPGHSRDILKYLLTSGLAISELQDFFLDRTLHPLGSGCFEEFCDWLVSKPHTEAHLDHYYVCVQKCLHVGLLSAREIQSLLTKLASAKVVSQGTIEKLGDVAAIQTWYWMMADTLSSCPIFGLNDLGEKCLQQWSFGVAEAPFAPCALDTFCKVQRYLATSDRFGFKVNTVRGLVRKWIDYTQAPHQQRLPSMDRSQQETKVANLLVTVQPSVAAKSICQITEKLVRDVLKGIRQPIALDIWMQTLLRFPRSLASVVLQQRSWRQGLAEDSVTGLSSRQAIAVRLWTVTRLATQQQEPGHKHEPGNTTQSLIRLFQRQLKPDQNLLAELLFTLQSLPLPSPSAVLQVAVARDTEGLQVRGSIDKLQADMIRICQSRISVFEEDVLYKNAKINLRSYLRQLAERVNTNPEAFLRLAHDLIMKDKLSIKVITRILEHNLPLGLSLAAPTQTPSNGSETTTPLLTPITPPPLAPAVAIHLVNSLARVFALSPVLSPRQSFRKVYWLYLYLHRFTWGIGIGRDFTRALWHAGVTRYKETGTSPEKVGWILSKVREVEGQEVADRLLWFGSGGVEGWEEWMVDSCGGVDREGWKRIFNTRISGTGTRTDGQRCREEGEL
ncbi:hypothetical protein EPUS_07696 [Endocarpon pusillum Z07020]|uniref:Uncharacterized protein n=1 Tax=Endocarpon pusillum (strain Z07020 / HMAS-L-300199) TaxID=1263415 RepID=U1G576_ENDPU|nr:uncharacterized protein EPUS_07696 [Endocarpon pusillum Z07020]ERF72487.1 hypothetical protein EPUS_07696 [Endocarpon pusillum Z07020]